MVFLLYNPSSGSIREAGLDSRCGAISLKIKLYFFGWKLLLAFDGAGFFCFSDWASMHTGE